MRESGILMHITSLPGPYGIGTMGKQAFDFVDFLHAAGQRYWQVLPLTPTSYGDSPYQSCSTFAGNHYLIDLDLLVEQGLLKRAEVKAVHWGDRADKVDFGLLYQNRLRILRLAYNRFRGSEEFEGFCRENSEWLPDFALFMVLKEKNSGKPWYEWEESLKFREPEAMEKARQAFAGDIRFYAFVQYLFHSQWKALRAYAKENQISVIGDVPIYVPLDSADVWCDPALFRLDKKLNPEAVAGVPPDAFTEDGQLWGNPLYRWEAHRKDGYRWWLKRLSAAGQLYDMIRLDHFRGFESYWAVPYGDTTAKNGKWIKGPGMDFIDTVKRELPNLRIIAEDLGFLTPAVFKMRDESAFPGMKVLEFAFDSKEPSDYLPHTYEKNTVCYTGTHDNMTVRQWLETADPDTLEYASDYMRLTEEEGLAWGVIRTAYASVSDLCVVQMQDLLDLGAEGRMNFPGSISDKNWTWRAKDGIITDDLTRRIYRLTRLYDRLGPKTDTHGQNDPNNRLEN